MIRFSKILLAVTLVFLALWQLPWCYAFVTAEPISAPFTLYSGVCDDFISVTHDDKKNMIGMTESGKQFSREETDSLLPFFYVRQLVTDDRLPDTIQGFAVTPRDIQLTNFNFRNSAIDMNTPKVALYPLLESLSKRVDLEMPDDVFRITDKGIEFIKMSTNQIKAEKSQKFTQMLLDKGFTFPARQLAGNPTPKKDYDEGYLVVDQKGKLFHLKQMQGRPYVRAIQLPADFEIANLFITEFKDKKTLGFIQDKNNKFFVLENKTYSLYDTGITDCDLNKYNITIIGNMADWTVWIDKEDCREYFALDASTYSIIKTRTMDFGDVSTFGLHFTSGTDRYVYPRF